MKFTGDVKGPSRGEWFPVNENGHYGYASGYSAVDTWESMEALVNEGMVRLAGVSNADKALIHQLQMSNSKVPVSVNQIEVHPGLRQDSLLEFANSRGVFTMAYGGLGGGRLVNDPHFVNLAQKREGCDGSTARVLLKWALARGIGVVVSSKNTSRMVENLGAIGCKLLEEDIKTGSSETAGVEKRYYRPEAFDFLF